MLCCEFEVRIDADGTETIAEIANLTQDVFRAYEDVIICKVLDKDARPIGELFPLTISNKDQVRFFIPSSSLRCLVKQIREIRGASQREHICGGICASKQF